MICYAFILEKYIYRFIYDTFWNIYVRETIGNKQVVEDKYVVLRSFKSLIQDFTQTAAVEGEISCFRRAALMGYWPLVLLGEVWLTV